MYTRLRGVVVLTALALVPVAVTPTPAQSVPPAEPNAVITWNINAQTAAFEVAQQSPTATARSFAMVQGAVYDAVNAIAGTPFEPYLVAPPTRPGDSTPAAVAAAAYHVLVSLFPRQAESLRTQYEASLAEIPDGDSEQGGIAVGTAAANAMIEARTGDGAQNQQWPVGTDPGEWRPTPPTFINAGAQWGTVRPFSIETPRAFDTPGPPALTSRAYARDFIEVKLLGEKDSVLRTDDQEEAAIWWDDPRLVEWEIKRQLAMNHRLSTMDTARLFAMLDIAAADTVIACYQEKLDWSFWRPVTAIPLANTDGNPLTRADRNWEPLRETSPSTEYPSGHACFTASTTVGLRTFFGRDDLSFSAFSEHSDTTRHFDSLSDAMAELVEARIWAGVHYRTAAVDGEVLGAAVTRQVLDREFQPRTGGE